ncbi:MAG: UDP-glucose/GDP-mannose dehydrogenase family protein [Candidatus Alcyoniella australis]|nr:UDP-glucose/GDP-mannose dehydrogenase family protein [Candidatus Alcyoniella australis]
MNIAVIGTGYVGLVAGTCLAETGNDVACLDIDKGKIETLQNGGVPIYEPGLLEMIMRNVSEGRLSFSTDIAAGVRMADVIFVAVGTPQDKDGSADLQYVLQVARSIGRAMNGYKVIVLKSTVPVGTHIKVRKMVKRHTKHKFDVVSNPEFMKEGAAVGDFLRPDRVVIGTDSSTASEVMQELYAPFVRNENPIYVMDNFSAEMTKYAANALLATKISFMNEIANLCDLVGADVKAVRKGVGSDSRIGFQFLFPGHGYGGSCFPKDVKALIRIAEEAGMKLDLVKSTDRVNQRQKKKLVSFIDQHYGPDLTGMTFAIWGLSFKPETDDMREAPSLEIIRALLKRKAKVRAYDPQAGEEAQKYFGRKIEILENSYDALEKADGLVVCTEWNEFRRPNYAKMRETMKQPVIFDGRNLYTPKLIRKMGFSYYCIGRNKAAN